MLLVHHQYNARSNFDSELQLKQDSSKNIFSEHKHFWEAESGCEEELETSGNETEREENLLYSEHSELSEEAPDTRRHICQTKKRPKNVRFGGPDFNCVLDTSETSSLGREYLTLDCGFEEGEGKGLVSGRFPGHQEPESGGRRFKNRLRLSHRGKCRAAEYCGFERRSNPEKSSGFLEGNFVGRRPVSLGEYGEAVEGRQRGKKKEHRCGRSYRGTELEHGCGELGYRKPVVRPYKFDCGEDSFLRQRHGDWCGKCPLEETRPKKNYVKLKPVNSSIHKHLHYTINESMEPENKNHRGARLPQDLNYDVYHTTVDRYCPKEEYHDHNCSSKTKKKILEAVQEQQEQFSDTTYKVPCSKFSSQTISGGLDGFGRKKSSEKLISFSQFDWKVSGSSPLEKMPRVHKMRSRRTRMNRLKNGWKRAFVQTVRDGTRNERVGVIVMGSKGPEFYSKQAKRSPRIVPFRKSKSFLDGAAKSVEMMTIDCKNVFLSSSEPGPRTNYAIADLVCPEDDAKMEEKIAKFNKNVNDIVKISEEKFYKGLSSSELQEGKKPLDGMLKGAGEGNHEEVEKAREGKTGNWSSYLPVDPPTFLRSVDAQDVPKSKLPAFRFEGLTPRIPQTLKELEKKFNEESKIMAETLNTQAKKYKEKQPASKEKEDSFLEELKELQEKYPPKEMSREAIEANLSLWGMKIDEFCEKEGEMKTKKNNGKLEKENMKNSNIINHNLQTDKEEKENVKVKKDEESQSGSDKPSQQVSFNKQRRKKCCESTAGGSRVESCGTEDPENSAAKAQPQQEEAWEAKVGRKSSRSERQETISNDPKEDQETSNQLVSAVFRDLVENGYAMTKEEFMNLQSMFNKVSHCAEIRTGGFRSSCSSDIVNTVRESKITVSPKSQSCLDKKSENKAEFRKIEAEEREKEKPDEKKGVGDISKKLCAKDSCESDDYLEDIKIRKVCHIKDYLEKQALLEEEEQKRRGEGDGCRKGNRQDDDESDPYQEELEKKRIGKTKKFCEGKASKTNKRSQGKPKEGKSKKKIMIEDKMKILREALPSIAAENEAAHLKQLKKYIDRFIDRVEASTTSEFRRRKELKAKTKDSVSTESSEVRVDARKILDFVSNPFKKISSDVTINIAKKLTDALVQDKASRAPKAPRALGAPGPSDTEDDVGASDGSEKCEEPEPTYLRQLKRMRNEHLNNIVVEVKRLSDLLRFLDRCHKLTI